MAIHGTGSPLSLSQIASEFGGDAPHSMSEYYAGGSNVPAGTSGNGGDIPSSGAINFNIFYTSQKVTRVAIGLTISSTTQNYNIYSNKGGTYSAGNSDVTLTVQAIVGSASNGQYAIDTGNQWASGDTVKIINNSQIVGAGGGGGAGAQGSTAQTQQQFSGSAGQGGGSAVNLGFATTIQNNGGFIRGAGGGGGGGGNAQLDQSTGKGANFTGVSGGGGGGGAGQNGGSAGGNGGGQSGSVVGQAGSISGAGNGGAGGSHGSPNPATAGQGGNGGGFGSAGQNGQTGTSRNSSGVIITGGSGGTGGASGKAVNLNGNTLTWEDGNTNVQGAVS